MQGPYSKGQLHPPICLICPTWCGLRSKKEYTESGQRVPQDQMVCRTRCWRIAPKYTGFCNSICMWRGRRFSSTATGVCGPDLHPGGGRAGMTEPFHFWRISLSINTTVQKADIQGFHGCLEHASMIWSAIQDLVNACGSEPHNHIEKARDFFYIPKCVRILIK